MDFSNDFYFSVYVPLLLSLLLILATIYYLYSNRIPKTKFPIQTYQQMKEKISLIPSFSIRKVTFRKCLYELELPNKSESFETRGGNLAGQIISTYPGEIGHKFGDPIVDHALAKIFKDNAILCIADGTGWGARHGKAATLASRTFANFLERYLCRAKSLREVAEFLMMALDHSHNAILNSEIEDTTKCGSTTFLGGVIVKFSDGAAAFVWISIGDCKAYRWSSEENKVIDFMGPGRPTTDRSDCGGRIGPYKHSTNCDIRNLRAGWTPVNKNDHLIFMTDGVTDNFDPEILGFDPSDIDPDDIGLKDANWASLAADDFPKFQSLMDEFTLQKIQEIIAPSGTILRLDKIVTTVMDYCKEVNSKAAKWLIENENGRLPKNYRIYPGKMDHTTCLAFKI